MKKIVIASPLFPPDIADPAPYVKDLAARLANTYDVTIVTYGRIPEAVPGIRIISIDKRIPTIIRLVRFTRLLVGALKNADTFYLQSGASAELPALFALTFCRPRILFRISEEPRSRSVLRRILKTMIRARATLVTTSPQLNKPEIFPLEPRPVEALEAHERAWNEHLADLHL